MHTPSVPTGSPRNPRATGASSSSIAVAWDTVDPFKRNGEIIMYEVLYLPLLTDEMTEIDPEMVNHTVGEAFMVQTAERVLFLRDLIGLTSYAIFVRALNIDGAGPYANKVEAVTLEDIIELELPVPTGPPLNLVAVGIVSGIAIAWDEVGVNQSNGMILAYEVLVGQNLTNTWALVNTVVPFISLTNLEEDVIYEISVRARNGNGPGPYSEVVIVTTLEDDISAGQVNTTSAKPLGAPRNVIVSSVTFTTLVLQWDKVNVTQQTDEGVSYAVHYQPLIEGSVENVVNTTDEIVVLMGLVELTPYVFSVRAFTAAGPGPFSEPGFVKTVENSKACDMHNDNVGRFDINLAAAKLLVNIIVNIAIEELVHRNKFVLISSLKISFVRWEYEHKATVHVNCMSLYSRAPHNIVIQ